MKKGIVILITFIIILIIPINNTYCENAEETLKSQQSEFRINDFIDSAQKYGGEFFEDINVSDLLNNAIKGEVNNSNIAKKYGICSGKEVKNNIKALGSILVIILISAILKAIGDGLENDGIAKMVYYVQYILIVTIIMANFTEIIKLVQETTNNLVAFMQILVPLLITLITYTGSVTTSTVLEPIILFLINFVCNLIQTLVIPLVLVFTSLVIISKISAQIQVDKLAKFLKSGIVWFLGIVLTIFVGVISLEGTLSSSVDGITAKTTKAVVSSAVPVVGKILGDAVDTVLGCGVILKNAVGVIGIIVIIGICIAPIIKLTILMMSYKLIAVVTQTIADSKISSLLEEIGDVFKIFLGILFTVSFMLIIGTALVVKMSNGVIMYR